MRLLLEILVVAALIALAWDKSYREHFSALPIVGATVASPTPSPVRQVKKAQPVIAPTPSGAWMWERHGTLDAPSKHVSPTPH